MSRRRGFTLIELLVVMGVIVVLMAFLLSAVTGAWQEAYAHQCKSNLRSLSQAFFAFAAANDGHLPGSRDTIWTDSNPDHWDWLLGRCSILEFETDPLTGEPFTLTARAQYAPQYGTIWKYISTTVPPPLSQLVQTPYVPDPHLLSIYRCPSINFDKSETGNGSNGRFDYFAFSCWSGANLKDINPVSQLHFPLFSTNAATYPAGDLHNQPDPINPYQCLYIENHPTPLLAHEDANIWSNTFLDSWGEYCREMTHAHHGGAYYAAIDGSIQFVIEPDGLDANNPSLPFYEGTSLWFQAGPHSGMARVLNFDPGTYRVTNGAVITSIGWGYWSHM
jgi:prepilin-type N-terminal cleavage/methylation domain-containing protein